MSFVLASSRTIAGLSSLLRPTTFACGRPESSEAERVSIMACRTSELVLGCRNPDVLAQFWYEVLDFVVLHREDDGPLKIGPREGFGGPQPTITLSRRDEPEKGKSRLHIDVNATDRDFRTASGCTAATGVRPRSRRTSGASAALCRGEEGVCKALGSAGG